MSSRKSQHSKKTPNGNSFLGKMLNPFGARKNASRARSPKAINKEEVGKEATDEERRVLYKVEKVIGKGTLYVQISLNKKKEILPCELGSFLTVEIGDYVCLVKPDVGSHLSVEKVADAESTSENVVRFSDRIPTRVMRNVSSRSY